MKFARCIMMAILAINLTACGEPFPEPVGQAEETPADVFRRKVEASVRASLKDPDSAKFQSVFVYPEQDIACGEVNARNSFGGYTGFTYFAYNHGGVIMPYDNNDEWKKAFNQCTIVANNLGIEVQERERKRVLADNTIPAGIRAAKLEKIDRRLRRYRHQTLPLLK